MSPSDANIIDLESLTSRAWRAEEEAFLGGWRLFASSGFSGRINACWPLSDPGIEVTDAVVRVEDWYRDRGLPCRFKVAEGACEPASLTAVLRERGYRPSQDTLAMVGPTGGHTDARVTVGDRPCDDFVSILLSTSPEPGDARERLAALQRVPHPRAFVVVTHDGSPAAVGAAAVEGRWAGIFAMRTAERHRRNGLARAVLSALLSWAETNGAGQAWLQVEADNPPAVKLYESRAFSAVYAYRYWLKGA